MKRALRILTAFVLPLVLMAGVACGSGSTSAPSAAQDKARAASIVLTASDLPGFEVDDPDDTGDEGGFLSCLDNPTWTEDPKPRGVESAFRSEDAIVNTGVLLTVTDAEAQQAFADAKVASTSQCVRDGMKAEVAGEADPGLTVGDVAIAPLPSLELGDESIGSRLAMEISEGRDRLSLFADLTFIRRGRIVTGLVMIQSGTPFPDAERIRLTTLVADRMDGKDEAAAGAATSPASTGARGQAAGDSPGWVRYFDPSGLRLEHPEGWTVDHVDEVLVLYLDPAGAPFRRNVNVQRQVHDDPVTIDEYTRAALREIRDRPDTTIDSSGPTTVSGAPAHRATGTTAGGERRFLSVWTVHDRDVWVITYASDDGPGRFAAGMADVERMLGTMKVPG